jgi:hypothetical protein
MMSYGFIHSLDGPAHEEKRRRSWRCGNAAKSRKQRLYDERMIDDRNARPLTIAFATIVMVWMLAFGVVSVSAQVSARSHHMRFVSQQIDIEAAEAFVRRSGMSAAFSAAGSK